MSFNNFFSSLFACKSWTGCLKLLLAVKKLLAENKTIAPKRLTIHFAEKIR